MSGGLALEQTQQRTIVLCVYGEGRCSVVKWVDPTLVFTLMVSVHIHLSLLDDMDSQWNSGLQRGCAGVSRPPSRAKRLVDQAVGVCGPWGTPDRRCLREVEPDTPPGIHWTMVSGREGGVSNSNKTYPMVWQNCHWTISIPNLRAPRLLAEKLTPHVYIQVCFPWRIRSWWSKGYSLATEELMMLSKKNNNKIVTCN